METQELSGGGWCGWLPPVTAAWGLQGLLLGGELWRDPQILPARATERGKQCHQDGVLATRLTGREGLQNTRMNPFLPT